MLARSQACWEPRRRTSNNSSRLHRTTEQRSQHLHLRYLAVPTPTWGMGKVAPGEDLRLLEAKGGCGGGAQASRQGKSTPTPQPTTTCPQQLLKSLTTGSTAVVLPPCRRAAETHGCSEMKYLKGCQIYMASTLG